MNNMNRLVISESNKKACIESIKQHCQTNRKNKTLLKSKHTLVVKKIYLSYKPLLCELLPSVLSDVIIEYIWELIDIDIKIESCIFLTCYSIHNSLITVKNELLGIHFSFMIKIINNQYQACDLNIKSNYAYNYSYSLFETFVNYYLKRHNEPNQLTMKYILKHTLYYDDMMSRITNHEEFMNQCNIIILLMNNLDMISFE